MPPKTPPTAPKDSLRSSWRVDTLPAPKAFEIPRGGVTRLDSLPPDTDRRLDSVRVMPGPGFGEPVRRDSLPDAVVQPVAPISPTKPDSTAPPPLLPDTLPEFDPLRATPAYMLRPGQWEAKWYNQIYTQTAYFDGSSTAIDQGARSTYYSGILTGMVGLRARINLGAEAWLQSVRNDAKDRSPLRVLFFENIPGSRTALTFFGPKVRIPLNRLMSLQSSFLFPTAKDPEGRNNGRAYLASENYFWWSQLTFQTELGARWQLYAQLDPYWNINRKAGNGFLALPASAFLTYLPRTRFSLFVMSQFWPQLGSGGFSAWWWQVGAGGKYALGDRLTLELAYGRFVAGRNSAGPATALNLGLRYIHW